MLDDSSLIVLYAKSASNLVIYEHLIGSRSHLFKIGPGQERMRLESTTTMLGTCKMSAFEDQHRGTMGVVCGSTGIIEVVSLKYRPPN